MMQIDYPHKLVKQLGAKVFAVYFLMACAEAEGLVPITHKWLMAQMPYSTSCNTVTLALRTLTDPECPFAVRVTGGWRLATAVQLPLMNQLEDGDDSRISQREILVPVVVNVESEESGDLLSTTLTTKPKNLSERDSRKRQVLAKLHELKIYGKKADKLADDELITVAEIDAQWKVVEAQQWDNPQGMLIYNLENHVPAPEEVSTSTVEKNSWWETRCEDCGEVDCICEHDDDCDCLRCRREFPERFCKAIYDAGRGNTRGMFRECKDLAVPGARYCEAHQDPSTRGHFDQDGKERESE